MPEKPAGAAALVVASGAFRRAAAVAALALFEVLLTSLLFNFPTGLAEWSNPVAYAKKFAHLGLFALAAFAIIVWPTRERVLALWRETAGGHSGLTGLFANLGTFAALLVATVALSGLAPQGKGLPLLWFALYCALLLATAGSLLLVMAPVSFWRGLLTRAPAEIALAGVSACCVLLAAELSKESWRALSAATLALSHWLLGLYETNVVLDMDRQLLGVGDFHVLILKECSGYEGAGLVTAFLALYVLIFRRELRFPNAFVLFPAAVAAVWMLNAVRIAALVSVGAHLSPAVAVDGFHSQAGWIAFLLVAAGTMAVSRRTRFFSAALHRRGRPAARPDQQLMLALLGPFMALMATSIVAAAFAPHDRWLYGLKVLGVGAALWWFRGWYADLAGRVSALSVAVGVGVGLLWIATDPAAQAAAPLGPWLAALPASLAAAWLALRAFGSIVLVPVAEELAFRGYLHRALIDRHFERVAPGRFTWLALVGSSLLFGLMHQRWLAAALAGAVFALLMYRTNRLSDPIAAHVAANATIVAWALAAGRWSLLA
jgi:exosortase E/protease (VPEID-CTERM system)